MLCGCANWVAEAGYAFSLAVPRTKTDFKIETRLSEAEQKEKSLVLTFAEHLAALFVAAPIISSVALI